MQCEAVIVPRVELPRIVSLFRSRRRNNLSKREREILRLLAINATNKFISKELQIAPKTVEKHLARIYKNLIVTSRAEAALWKTEASFPILLKMKNPCMTAAKRLVWNRSKNISK